MLRIPRAAAACPRMLAALLMVMLVPPAFAGGLALRHTAIARGAIVRRHHHHRRRHRHRRRATSTAVASVNSLPGGSCANANTPVTAATVGAVDAAVVCLVNGERTGRGLPALHVSSRLTSAALSWTDEMVATGQYTHGINFAGRILAVGYDLKLAGENIVTGDTTPSKAVAAWMASTAHCENILNPTFMDTGVGEDASPVGLVTRIPGTWTEDFGLTQSETPASQNTGPSAGCPYSS